MAERMNDQLDETGGQLAPARPWSDPSSDPLGDIQRFMAAWRDAQPSRQPVKFEVTQTTLDALRSARSDAQRDAAVPGMAALAPFPVWLGTPVFTVDDVEDGKARVTYDDGTVEVIPET